jgi:hypothetical protein
LIDVGLALATANDGQEPDRLQRFEMLADIGLMQPEIIRQPELARKTVVALPGVAEQMEKVILSPALSFFDRSRKLGTWVKPWVVRISAPLRMMF